MVFNYVRKTQRASWSEDALQQAINEAKKIGTKQAAIKFGISYSVLQRRVKTGCCKKSLGRFKPIFSEEEELELVEHLKSLGAAHNGLTKTEFTEVAGEYANRKKKQVPFKNNVAGKQWLKNFKKRHPETVFRVYSSTSKDRSAKFNKAAINRYFNKIEKKKKKEEIKRSKEIERVESSDNTNSQCNTLLEIDINQFQNKNPGRVIGQHDTKLDCNSNLKVTPQNAVSYEEGGMKSSNPCDEVSFASSAYNNGSQSHEYVEEEYCTAVMVKVDVPPQMFAEDDEAANPLNVNTENVQLYNVSMEIESDPLSFNTENAQLPQNNKDTQTITFAAIELDTSNLSEYAASIPNCRSQLLLLYPITEGRVENTNSPRQLQKCDFLTNIQANNKALRNRKSSKLSKTGRKPKSSNQTKPKSSNQTKPKSSNQTKSKSSNQTKPKSTGQGKRQKMSSKIN
jgi:hypothetical protein